MLNGGSFWMRPVAISSSSEYQPKRHQLSETSQVA